MTRQVVDFLLHEWLGVGSLARHPRFAEHGRVVQPACAQDAARAFVETGLYFFDYELPKVDAWLAVVASRNPACREMREEWF